jgi:uncharacterized membrane protein
MAPALRRALPRWITITTLGLSLLAVGLTTYLTVTHYTDPTALACPDTGIVNCTAVTTSSWSVILGVPVALIGLLWAASMTALNSPWAWRSSARWLATARLVLSGAGALMVFYLVYVELFRVDAICLWCSGVHVTTIALFGVILAARASLAPDAPGASDAAGTPGGTARTGGTEGSRRSGRSGARGRNTKSLAP